MFKHPFIKKFLSHPLIQKLLKNQHIKKLLSHDFFKQKPEFYRNIGLGILVGFSGIFVFKRLLNPPTVYFCKYIMEDRSADRGGLDDMPVEALTVKTERIQKRLTSIGTVKGQDHVVIKTQQQNARIKEILFNEGESVEEGDELIRFDDQEALAQYEEEKARMEAAKLNFKRQERLYKQGAQSKAEYDKAEGEYKSALGRFEQSESNLDKMTIRAPISGTIGVIETASVGSVVSPNKPLVTIVKDDKVNLFFKIPLKDHDELTLGSKVLFKTDAFESEFEGSIEAIDSKIEESTILVRAEIHNKGNLLRSGMLGDIQVITDTRINAFTVPSTAIAKQGEKDYVFSIYKNRILYKQVIKGAEIEASGDKKTVVEQGLKSGEKIIKAVSPQKMLEGMPVFVIKLDNEDVAPQTQNQAAQQNGQKRSPPSGPLVSFCRYMLEDLESIYAKTPAVAISASEVEARTVYKKIPAVGTIKSQKFVELKTHTAGSRDFPITDILFSEGDRVKKDEVLIRFDDKEASAKVNEERARMKAAEAQFKRAETLFKKNADTRANFEKIEAEYKMAMARFLNAYARLEKMLIRAPFEGTIGIMQATVGSLPESDKTLVTIVDDEKVDLFFRVPAKYIQDIGLGQSVIFKVETYENKEFEGTVVAIDSVIEELSQTILLRAEIDNKDRMLKSGMMGRVELIIDEKKNAIAVPESALAGLSGQMDILYTVQNEQATRVVVDKGFGFVENDRAYRLINKGLKAGDILINELGANLRPDSPVKIVVFNGEPVTEKTEKQATVADENLKEKEEEKKEETKEPQKDTKTQEAENEKPEESAPKADEVKEEKKETEKVAEPEVPESEAKAETKEEQKEGK